MKTRTTVRSRQRAAGISAAGIRGIAEIGGVTKAVRFYCTGGEVSACNLTAGFVALTDDEVRSYRWVTRNYADAAATNMGYLRHQNMLAASFIPETRWETLREFLADSRWDGVRDRDAVLAHYYPEG